MLCVCVSVCVCLSVWRNVDKNRIDGLIHSIIGGGGGGGLMFCIHLVKCIGHSFMVRKGFFQWVGTGGAVRHEYALQFMSLTTKDSSHEYMYLLKQVTWVCVLVICIKTIISKGFAKKTIGHNRAMMSYKPKKSLLIYYMLSPFFQVE